MYLRMFRELLPRWELREPLVELTLDLPTGQHTLLFEVYPSQRSGRLRCELRDVAGSKARAAVVGGR